MLATADVTAALEAPNSPFSRIVVGLFLLTGFFAISAPVAHANSVIRVEDTVSVAEEQVVEGDFYGIGTTVAISGEVLGDLQVLGGRMTLNGKVASDTLAIGLSVDMHGDEGDAVGDDVRVVASEVTISRHIKGDLVVVARQLKVLSTAQIDGDIIFFGQDAEISGAVGHKVMGRMTNLRIDGKVGGDVNVTVGNLTLGERANVTGTLQYASVYELIRAQNAVVSGNITRNESAAVTPKNLLRTVLELLLPLLFASLCWFLLFRNSLEKLVGSINRSPLRSALVGLSVAVVVPLVATLLIVSTLGALLGWLLLVFYVLMITVSAVGGGAVIGGILRARLLPTKPFGSLWILLGTTCFAIILLLPYGIFIAVAIMLITLGAACERLYLALK